MASLHSPGVLERWAGGPESLLIEEMLAPAMMLTV
jgi:hypothetical protein